MQNGLLMNRIPMLALVVVVSMALPRTAEAAVAQEPAVGPIASMCDIQSSSATWKVPVGAAGIPVFVSETGTAKFTPEITVTPATKTTLVVDTTSSTPTYARLLTFPEAKEGDIFKVALSGVCSGGTTSPPRSLTVEFTAAAVTPAALGKLVEAPQGLTKLVFDASFLPYAQLATLAFSANDRTLGEYRSGRDPSGTDYGVQACVNGACNPMWTPELDTLSNSHLISLMPNAQICPSGRASGMITAAVSVKARVAGQRTELAPVTGQIHVDCSKATDEELGLSSNAGCSTVARCPSEAASLASALFALFCSAGIVARRRGAGRSARHTVCHPGADKCP